MRWTTASAVRGARRRSTLPCACHAYAHGVAADGCAACVLLHPLIACRFHPLPSTDAPGYCAAPKNRTIAAGGARALARAGMPDAACLGGRTPPPHSLITLKFTSFSGPLHPTHPTHTHTGFETAAEEIVHALPLFTGANQDGVPASQQPAGTGNPSTLFKATNALGGCRSGMQSTINKARARAHA